MFVLSASKIRLSGRRNIGRCSLMQGWSDIAGFLFIVASVPHVKVAEFSRLSSSTSFAIVGITCQNKTVSGRFQARERCFEKLYCSVDLVQRENGCIGLFAAFEEKRSSLMMVRVSAYIWLLKMTFQ